MIRSGRVILALAVLMLLPAAAEAQRDTRQTREASKYLGLAMTRQDPAQRNEMYEQAMTHLRQGMEQDANNAKVWLLAGQVYAGMGSMTEADAAFLRAVEIHPEYAEEIAQEREQAWVDKFNEGIGLMDEQRYEEAIAALEQAQVIYKQRPEALMNLGALYANRQENAKARDAFEQAVESTRGPLFEQLDEEGQESWLRFRDMATLNVAQMAAQEGVDAFEARRYADAAELFKRAAKVNPQARDYIFNHVQSLWALTSDLEDVVEANAEGAAQARQQLLDLYPEIEQLAAATRKLDPNNELLFLIEARSSRMRGDLLGTEPERDAGHQAALKLLQEHDALPWIMEELIVISGAEGTVLRGAIKNRKLEVGTPVQIEFSLVDLDGDVVGTQVITVTAPAAEETASFEGRVDVEGEMAGWRYAPRS
ncbi:MAG TPA: tetratricopeptide repeat protein [Longimicrobiales bacterium]|nr:tetratricopeptide repeat protein [Longimicrobiales bacterium]